MYKNKKDKINCLKTREWVLENIDWKCELKLFFSGKNLSCHERGYRLVFFRKTIQKILYLHRL